MLPDQIAELLKQMSSLSAQDRKEAAEEITDGLPPAEKKDVAIKAASDLGAEAKAEIARSLNLPTQRTTDIIWLVVVVALAVVLLVALIALVVLKYQDKPGAELLLSVFLAVLGYLMGLLTPKPTANT